MPESRYRVGEGVSAARGGNGSEHKGTEMESLATPLPGMVEDKSAVQLGADASATTPRKHTEDEHDPDSSVDLHLITIMSAPPSPPRVAHGSAPP